MDSQITSPHLSQDKIQEYFAYKQNPLFPEPIKSLPANQKSAKNNRENASNLKFEQC